MELVWIHEREELEVTRNWSDVQHLDIPMLQNYFKQVSGRLGKKNLGDLDAQLQTKTIMSRIAGVDF